MILSLRPYQTEGIGRVRERIRIVREMKREQAARALSLANVQTSMSPAQPSLASFSARIVFVLPTGGGKTVVASSIIASCLSLGRRCLFVAHRRELIKQAFCKLIRSGLNPEDVGVVMAGVPSGSCELFPEDVTALDDETLWKRFARRRPMAGVQVASIDTLRMRHKPEADLLVIDECHRALAKSYRDLVAEYPMAVVLGLTATPYRADNKGLGQLFDDLVVIASPASLVAEGFLVEPVGFTVGAKSLPDLAAVGMKGTDYDPEALEKAVDKSELVGDIVAHWQQRAEGRRTVVFAASVAHSKHIVERFRAAGVFAEHLDGTTPNGERDAILGRLARGETQVVSNCGVLCEGWDMPSVKCLILARPTKSLGLFLQMAGRILRPWEGVGALILDHAGSVNMHGWPTWERDFSLDPPKKRKKRDDIVVPAMKTCPQCWAMVQPAVRVCPGCQFEFPAPASKEIEETAGELIKFDAAEVRAKQLAAWGDVVEAWHTENRQRIADLRAPHAPEWCRKEFKRRFGRVPPGGAKYPDAIVVEERPTRQRRASGGAAAVLEEWHL